MIFNERKVVSYIINCIQRNLSSYVNIWKIKERKFISTCLEKTKRKEVGTSEENEKMYKFKFKFSQRLDLFAVSFFKLNLNILFFADYFPNVIFGLLWVIKLGKALKIVIKLQSFLYWLTSSFYTCRVYTVFLTSCKAIWPIFDLRQTWYHAVYCTGAQPHEEY